MFSKYNSIENSYREKFLEYVRQTSAANDIWYVSEKEHGSNFVVSYCNGKVTYGKRSGPLDDNENFYNHKELFKDLESKIIESLSSMINTDSRITYYGEIFGPGVQKGVDYGVKQFRFFDVYFSSENIKYWVDQHFLPGYVIPGVLELVPQLGSGTLDEVLAWNCEFDSKILNIPNNPAEGIVLKPDKYCVLEGSGDRIILKKKHPKFSEIAHASDKPIKVRESLPEFVTKYITVNRLNNVFSKIEPSFKNFNLIKKEFVEDIYTEINKDMDAPALNMSEIEKVCTELIREELKKVS